MDTQIICEDFKLTDAIQDQVHEKVAKIQSHMKHESPFKVFLAKSGPNKYSVKIETQFLHHSILGAAEADDFYLALNQAKKAALRQVDDLHDRNARDKRQQ